ncbi:MAG: hypothetical protein VB119_06880 [Candidatus Metalachnospira sp.]|nr:hypothetical protein [Candidatus Metalachnospira sp.]
MDGNIDRCFIITPIGNDTDPIRRHIEGIIAAAIEPAIGEKYEIVVAHKMGAPGSITKQIISEIYNDKLVIVNLTNKNPNVMYELAFRHSLGKPVIMIAEDGTALPSDIIMERTVFYKNDAQGVLDLRDKLIAAEKEIPYDGKESSPIYDVIKEIDRDNRIIQLTQEASNTSEDDKNALKYILNKLNNIEETIKINRNDKTIIESSYAYKNHIIYRMSYDFAPETITESTIVEGLFGSKDLDNYIDLTNISWDKNAKTIELGILYKDDITKNYLSSRIISVMSSIGFTEIHTYRRTMS